MFLAINEIRHSKLRYLLVIGILFLIAYLVFFLTGLAYGLAQDNRTAVDNWQAENILIAEEANNNLAMSMIPRKVFTEVEAQEKAILSQFPGVVKATNQEEAINVSFFGIDPEQFLNPQLIEGDNFAELGQAVADSSLKEQYGLAIGDNLRLAGNSQAIEIVGFTENAKFNVAPVLYVSFDTLQQIRFERIDSSDNARINAIVTRGKVSEIPEEVVQIPIADFINDLPGYSAQVLTFGFMIGFLIIIAAIVIGIFIYVLTMQKIDIFGVMKAQGISSSYISQSVVAQTFILVALGVFLGLLVTILTAIFLPVEVPFQINYLFLLFISGLIIAFAILGAFFSVRAVVKIDPLKAIG